MTDLTEIRTNIQVEEVDYVSAVSEGTFSRIGQSINFINKRQYDVKEFKMNGVYYVGIGDQGVDGTYSFIFDGEIVGMHMFNAISSGTGSTTLDVHRLTTAGDQGSIFSTKPSMTSAAGNSAYFTRDILNTIDYQTNGGTGITLPVFSVTQFNAGDALRLDLDSAMSAGENCSAILFFRPR